jgi:hypothetical protein
VETVYIQYTVSRLLYNFNTQLVVELGLFWKQRWWQANASPRYCDIEFVIVQVISKSPNSDVIILIPIQPVFALST